MNPQRSMLGISTSEKDEGVGMMACCIYCVEARTDGDQLISSNRIMFQEGKKDKANYKICAHSRTVYTRNAEEGKGKQVETMYEV